LNSISNSYEFLKFLKEQNLLEAEPINWWPNDNDFEILLGSILN
jgi:endonuclease III-like uncharacterized protein